MKIVVLTSVRNGPASRCLPMLCASPAVAVDRVIYVAGSHPARWRRLRRKFRKVARIGLGGALNGLRMRNWYADTGNEDIEVLCRRHGVRFETVPYLSSDATAAQMKDAAADLGLSLGNGYIAQRIFRMPAHGMINLHMELLPEYQNASSVVWSVFNGATWTGLTVHQIDAGIDTGPILHQERYRIEFRDTLEATVRATMAIAWQRVPFAILDACERFQTLKASARPQERGQSYTTPTLAEYRRMVANNQRLWRSSTADAACGATGSGSSAFRGGER